MAIAREAAPQTADMRLLAAGTRPLTEVHVLAPEDYLASPPSADRLVWVVNLGRGDGLDAEGTSVVIDLLDGTVYGVINWRS